MTTQGKIKVHELLHRLQTLEVQLKDASVASEYTEADIHTRVEKLRRVTAKALKLNEMMSTKTLLSEVQSQVDLPVMADYSRIEQKVVSKFVMDTLEFTKDLAQKMRSIHEWSIEYDKESPSIFKSVWRLSWIRRNLRKVEHEVNAVRSARSVMEDFISKSAIASHDAGAKSNQKDLLATFEEFESVTGRVTALKARIQSETAQNVEMHHWLDLYSKRRRSRSPEMEPPEPDSVADATRFISDQFTSSALIARERLIIARQLAGALKKFEKNDLDLSNVESSGELSKLEFQEIVTGGSKQINIDVIENEIEEPS